MATDPGMRARMTSWCSICNAMIAVGDPMWPRFDQAGWICMRCANSQQPTPTERLLAWLTCESLGLPRQVWANHSSITLEELRLWEFEEPALPATAAANLEKWRSTFNDLALELADRVAGITTEPPVIAIFATDRSYWAHGGTPPTPASMPRAAVATVLQDQPTLRVAWG